MPVGTEPMLSGPQLGTFGHMYGFSMGPSAKPVGAGVTPGSFKKQLTSATVQGKYFLIEYKP